MGGALRAHARRGAILQFTEEQNHAWTLARRTGIHRQAAGLGPDQGTFEGHPQHLAWLDTRTGRIHGARHERDAFPSTARNIAAARPHRDRAAAGWPAQPCRCRAGRANQHAPAACARAGASLARSRGPRRNRLDLAARALHRAGRRDRHRGKKNAAAARQDTEVALSTFANADQEIVRQEGARQEGARQEGVGQEGVGQKVRQEVANQDSSSARTLPIRMELELDPGQATWPFSIDEPQIPDVHMNILRTYLDLRATPTPPRRGAAHQQPRRQLELHVRQRAVEVANRLTDLGCNHADAAQHLGVNARTLRAWRASCAAPATIPLLGRPCALAAPAQRQSVLDCVQHVGPGIGVPTLRRLFDGIARAELDELLKQYRRQWRADHSRLLHVLHWQRPGTVWAADFAHAPGLIDGSYPYILAVRDLASGFQLLWQPVSALTADVLLNELTLLFALHGTPWLLKTDNGSAFRADRVRWHLHRCHVLQLFSPPHTPSYNGAIEASIGALKKRPQQHSERAGPPGQWTSDILEAARLQANATARPRRLHGLTPQQAWDARTPLCLEQRDLFRATVVQCQNQARLERGLQPQQPLSRSEQAAVDRVAFRRALVAHDLLWFRRRRIPPPITRPKAAN